MSANFKTLSNEILSNVIGGTEEMGLVFDRRGLYNVPIQQEQDEPQAPHTNDEDWELNDPVGGGTL